MEQNECLPNLVVPLHWKAVVLCDGSRFDWHRKRARAARDRERLEGPLQVVQSASIPAMGIGGIPRFGSAPRPEQLRRQNDRRGICQNETG